MPFTIELCLHGARLLWQCGLLHMTAAIALSYAEDEIENHEKITTVILNATEARLV